MSVIGEYEVEMPPSSEAPAVMSHPREHHRQHTSNRRTRARIDEHPRDKRSGPPRAGAAAREELARYTVSEGTRALVRYGTPTTGSVWDEPVGRPGTRYLVEPRVDCASMSHLLADYVEQSRRRDCPAMIVDLDFGVPEEDRRLSKTSWPPAASTRN